MNTKFAALEPIRQAAAGLLYISESDHPFEVVEFSSGDIEKEIRTITGRPADTPVESQTVDYFFRNMIRTYPGYTEEQKETAKKFLALQEMLKQNLEHVQVFRIGSIQVDAFIVGKLATGVYGGLRTKLIET